MAHGFNSLNNLMCVCVDCLIGRSTLSDRKQPLANRVNEKHCVFSSSSVSTPKAYSTQQCKHSPPDKQRVARKRQQNFFSRKTGKSTKSCTNHIDTSSKTISDASLQFLKCFVHFSNKQRKYLLNSLYYYYYRSSSSL